MVHGVGDSNMIRSQAKRAPLRRSSCSVKMFNEFIKGGNWMNPPLLNGLFTWANRRARSRIDIVLLFSGWIQLFVGGRSKSHFGHWPIILTSRFQNWGPCTHSF